MVFVLLFFSEINNLFSAPPNIKNTFNLKTQLIFLQIPLEKYIEYKIHVRNSGFIKHKFF